MRLRVRFAETDQMGIAHHSAYVVWLEAGRVEWLRERGLSYRQLEDEGVSLAVSGVEVGYRTAARFDDEIEVETTLVEARSRRFRFSYRLTRTEDSALLATGSTVHVPTDRRGRAMRLPEEWLDRLLGLVGGERK
ncbi:MAG TPA: thioesterase family protein [Trueperaceae bacterium]